jgi:zinc transport system substrate-binding protein
MNRSSTAPVAILVAASIAWSGCSPGGPRTADTEARLNVHVVNYPLKYFAERIGGDRVNVELPVPPSVDPASWSPDAEALAGYRQADVVLLNGAAYASWVDEADLPASALVLTSAGVRDRWVPLEPAPGDEPLRGERRERATASHTWLDLKLALEQARVIERLFSHRIPEGEPEFRRNYEALRGDLAGVDASLESLARSIEQPLLASRPVYQYLAAGYGLDIVSVGFDPGAHPDEAAWGELERALERRPARWMLWDAEPLSRTAERLRELGVESVVYSPCGNVPEDGDFLTVARRNLEALSRVAGR